MPHAKSVGELDEQRIQIKMRELAGCEGAYAPLDDVFDRKRQAWWEAHKDALRLSGPSPRQAYTLLIVEYLQIDPAQAPVVYEDETRIVWHSANFCPTLEACLRLGLDTRLVCRGGSEGSVQRLIAHLDARLRFSRNYASGMRPYAPYCEESVQLVSPT